jgi:sec-independent protein translocase protein TatB
MLRTLRQMARNATTDLSRELGTQVELEDLNPKTLLRKHLLSEEDEQALRKPLQDVYRDVRGAAESVTKAADVNAPTAVTPPAAPRAISPRSYDDVT